MKLATTLLLVLAATAPAAADKMTDYDAAAQQLSERQYSATTPEAMPRAADAKVAAQLAAVTDVDGLLRARSWTKNDLGTLVNLCAKANELTMRYTLFGLQQGGPPTDAAQLTALMQKNYALFEPEIVPLMAFNIECQATVVGPITEFVRGLKPGELNDARKKGLAQFRSGLRETFLGGLQAVQGATATASSRRIAATLASTAPTFAPVLPLAVRDELRAAAQKARAGSPAELKAPLGKIADAMKSRKCVDLCAIAP